MKVTAANVRRLIRKWHALLGLEPQWQFEVRIHATESDCPEDMRDAEAAISANDGYFHAVLVINSFNVDNLELAIVHELTHIVLWELSEIALAAYGDKFEGRARAAFEAATERISRALVARR